MTRLPLCLTLLLLACKDQVVDSEPDDSGPVDVVDQDGDGVPAEEDCDDSDATINPQAAEVCDGVDNDCDGLTDDEDDDVDVSAGVESWADADGDSYGAPDSAAWSCALGAGRVENAQDCDDGDADVNPAASEVCDGVDNDCDALVDDADDTLDASSGVMSFQDADTDGYGDAEQPAWTCDVPSGYVTDSSDCDDGDASVNPGQAEVCDQADNDCNGQIDEGLLGAGEACAADDCEAIYLLDNAAADGAYYIDHDGDSSTTAIVLQCNMTAGGWTLGLLINSIKVDSHPDFGASEVSLDALALSPASTSDLAYTDTVQGWLDLNSADYSELMVAAYGSGAETYLSNPIDRSELRIPFGDNGYYLYNDSNGYYWCGGDHAYTDNGVGQVDQPSGAPADCKGHTSLGSGWDFSAADTYNQGLTNCGVDYSQWMYGGWATSRIYYPNPGAAQAIWIR